ncbi:hypothetical protein AB0M28_32220 [Streptomyces sp. NPDC051940]|uniref:hypothetical protein n=1 Tax=Streptomyces sp. NPDC051940 TaxID=3155675 RepID=UPI003428406F
MSSFFDKAREQAQSAYNQGKGKLEEVQAGREGGDKLRRLGAAYFNASRGQGDQDALQDALEAVRQHAEEHGDEFLTKATKPSTGTGHSWGGKHAA